MPPLENIPDNLHSLNESSISTEKISDAQNDEKQRTTTSSQNTPKKIKNGLTIWKGKVKVDDGPRIIKIPQNTIRRLSGTSPSKETSQLNRSNQSVESAPEKTPPKRPRGRPKKSEERPKKSEERPKRSVGRPKKLPTTGSSSPSETPKRKRGRPTNESRLTRFLQKKNESPPQIMTENIRNKNLRIIAPIEEPIELSDDDIPILDIVNRSLNH